MTAYPLIDPVALAIGPFKIHWYGLMFLFGFATAWWLGRKRAWHLGWHISVLDNYATWSMFGALLGARLGYVLFYDLPFFLANPVNVLKLWHGGMSFHGGMLGVLFVSLIFARRYDLCFLQLTDFAAPMVTPGLFFGRIGNFINSELWGKTTDLPWGMVFPNGGQMPRHPSQLYEAALEGILLFIILWIYSTRPRPLGRVSGIFAFGYGLCRFLVEFIREPDSHIGYLAFDWLTMGQILCVPLLIIGGWLLLRKEDDAA
jgi:phosphatidylglycerol:prolipoprotein diacylglycerol transferase